MTDYFQQLTLFSKRRDVISFCSAVFSQSLKPRIEEDFSNILEKLSSAILFDCSLVDCRNLSKFAGLVKKAGKQFLYLVPPSVTEEVVKVLEDSSIPYVPYPCSKDVLLDFFNHNSNSKSILSCSGCKYSGAFSIVKNQINNSLNELLGKSDAIKKLKESILDCAKTDGPVLLLGESGTGKNKTAELIHKLSCRNAKEFVPVSLITINESLIDSALFGAVEGAYTDGKEQPGFFKKANGGTIFLDEIGTISLDIQAKLLTLLEPGGIFYKVGSQIKESVDVRMIFATNEDLIHKIHEKNFRQDLYFRMAETVIEIPPLRERIEDIPVLAESFSSKKGKTISEQAIEKLMGYKWPGNIRQLEKCIYFAASKTRNEEILPENIVFTM